MFKRIEFTLNMEDPDEAALYQALQPSLRDKRAGTVIRRALFQFYSERQQRSNPASAIGIAVPSGERHHES